VGLPRPVKLAPLKFKEKAGQSWGSLPFSPDGKLLATESGNRRTRPWCRSGIADSGRPPFIGHATAARGRLFFSVSVRIVRRSCPPALMGGSLLWSVDPRGQRGQPQGACQTHCRARQHLAITYGRAGPSTGKTIYSKGERARQPP